VTGILNGLNEQQTKSVTYSEGPLLVLAGPGAGKTTVLTRRIAFILNQSEGEHFKVLALTFTNKASREMKDRVKELVGDEVKRVFVGTFHGFSHELIRSYGSYIGISQDFVIYDKPEDYMSLLLDGVRRRLNEELREVAEQTVLSLKYKGNLRLIEESIPKYYYAISRLKNRLIFHDQLNRNEEKYSEEFRIIYEIYDRELRNASVLDFPDLILYANKLLEEKPFIADQLRTVYKHVLIDEGQDTNKAQFELITRICGENFQNLFAVADEDQLIFEWNDARFEYLVSLVEKYHAETIQLYESYRCPNDILVAANQLIKHNRIRIQSKGDLLPKAGKSEQSITVNAFDDQNEEALFVCNKIQELNEFTSTCVISRNRYILERVSERLDSLSVPHYSPMGQRRFNTREMNLLIDLLRLVFNENDQVHFHDVCKYWDLDYESIVDILNGSSLLENLVSVSGKGTIPAPVLEILDRFRNSKRDFWPYYEHLKGIIIGEEVEDEDLIEDIESFEETYKHYTYERPTNERSLGDFLNFISLSPKKDLKKKGVALLTGHAAKGLEFEYVFLISMNQGIFPDYRAKEGTRALEEERRNCFVAVTRTKKKLYISFTRIKDTRFGQRPHEPSQFLMEMGLI